MAPRQSSARTTAAQAGTRGATNVKRSNVSVARSAIAFLALGLSALLALGLSGTAFSQLQPLGKEREEELLKAQQRLEFTRNAANNANRQLREAESNLATARARQRAANEAVTRAERVLEDARTKAQSAVELHQQEAAAFQELRRKLAQ